MSTAPDLAVRLAECARAAGLAPSVHNTQPWRWRVYPDHIDLYADRSRQLGVADTEGRLLILSCGAALHHAQVALAAAGWEPEVQRWPQRPTETPAETPAEMDLLARVRPGTYLGPTAEAIRRFQAAQTRRTDRRTGTDEPVDPRLLAKLRAAAEAHQVHLHVLRPEQVSDLAAAAGQAEAQAAGQPALRAELAYWTGGDHPPGTGVLAAAVPREPPHTPVPVRDFGHPGTLEPGEGTGRAATYAVLFGDEDGPACWLRAGEALSEAWLTACAHGVAVLPFSGLVEAPGTRTTLWKLLSGLGQPYLVLRLSRADPDHPGPPPADRLLAGQTVEIMADPR